MSEQDWKDLRSGAVKQVGALAVVAVLGALGAAFALAQKADPMVVLILIGAAIFVGFFAIALFLTYLDERKLSRSQPVAVPLLSTPAGRKSLANSLLVFKGQGVHLQTGAGSGWATEQEMGEWLTRDGQWVGEILGTMRAHGCSHPEIDDIGVLTPPRFVTFPPGASAHEPFILNHDRYQSMVTERLYRLKELLSKYDVAPTPA